MEFSAFPSGQGWGAEPLGEGHKARLLSIHQHSTIFQNIPVALSRFLPQKCPSKQWLAIVSTTIQAISNLNTFLFHVCFVFVSQGFWINFFDRSKVKSLENGGYVLTFVLHFSFLLLLMFL